jgi:hypothetical protein
VDVGGHVAVCRSYELTYLNLVTNFNYGCSGGADVLGGEEKNFLRGRHLDRSKIRSAFQMRELGVAQKFEPKHILSFLA